jgi:type VI secretion system secreted protein VgrG
VSLKAILENRLLRLSGPLPASQMFLRSARVNEGLSELSEITLEFISPDRKLDLSKIVGQKMKVEIKTAEDAWRSFAGTCIEAQYLGLYEGYGLYSAELRPWLWFLTRAHDNRIFQEKKVNEIIKEVFQEHGFSDFEFKLSGTYQQRHYTVQYRESDFDFVSRLMEEEGLYFFSSVQSDKETLVIADDIGAHSPVKEKSTIDFNFRETEYRRRDDHIFEWQSQEQVTSGKVTLTDYDFEKPKSKLKVTKEIAKGTHGHKSYEIYEIPGRYRETSLGENYARVLMEQKAAEHQTRSAVGNVRTLAVGETFKLQGHPRADECQEYLIKRATHLMQIETDYESDDTLGAILPGRLDMGEKNRDTYRCMFDVQPKATVFRAPRKTPWPEVPGLLLATVTGPSGEEIHTDKYGRIKVQFHWDLDGQNDEHTTCWVRTVMPWTGKGWGFVAIPRIGQEVVIQFENGDPDRPICTGMLYNADTMPPYPLPDNKTRSGIQSRSTKDGGETNYNELVFEDKKGEEFIRFHAEKNFWHTIENDAVVRIGLDKKDPGDLTTTIHRHRTETIKTGDLTLTVETGNEIRDIATDQTIDIGANRAVTIQANDDLDIKGNLTEKVTGNMDTSVTGNQSDKVTGNITIDAKGKIDMKALGKITVSSVQEIELKVGPSSIKIDNTGVTIKGMMVKVDGTMMTEVKGGIVTIVKGGFVLIN